DLTMRLWILAIIVAAGFLSAVTTATADTAVVGLNPKVARPGERVNLRIACGNCDAGASFPVSLVPVANAPRPYPCHGNAVCSPTTAAAPRQRPFFFLGWTASGARPAAVRPPVSNSHLRFTVPKTEPGTYAFVVLAINRRGPSGTLIADTRPAYVLRVLPSDASADSAGDG